VKSHSLIPTQRIRRRRLERGLSTVEYVVIMVLVAAVAIGAWRLFGQNATQALRGADSRFSELHNSALTDGEGAPGGTSPGRTGESSGHPGATGGLGDSLDGRSGGASSAPGGADRSAGPLAPAGGGAQPRPSAAAGSGTTAPRSGGASQPSAAALGSPAVAGARPQGAGSTAAGTPQSAGSASASAAPTATPATAVAPGASSGAEESSPPPENHEVRDFLAGAGVGGLQALPPGGALLSAVPMPTRASELGRGVGELTAGVLQILGGSAETVGGGGMMAVGVAGAPETLGGSLVVTGGGVAVSADGVRNIVQGGSNVVAGAVSIWRAATMSPPSPPATTPAPRPASGAQPPSPPPPTARPPPGGGKPPPNATPIGPPPPPPQAIPGRVASRINLAEGRTRFTPLRSGSGQPVSAGWRHVVEGHFNRAVTNSRSVFTISQQELRALLQSKQVVSSPVTLVDGQFSRTVDVGRAIGQSTLKNGGGATSVIQIFTDEAGNLITAFPL